MNYQTSSSIGAGHLATLLTVVISWLSRVLSYSSGGAHTCRDMGECSRRVLGPSLKNITWWGQKAIKDFILCIHVFHHIFRAVGAQPPSKFDTS